MNAHGLSRDIPEPIKRAVRQRCGFGCIICGSAVVDYHHFSPEYKDAIEHRAEGITLLCGRCHAKTGQAGPEEIALRNASPICKQTGFAKDFLFASRGKVNFQIGSAVFKRHIIVSYDNEVLIGFEPPEESGSPLRLFARFYDDKEEALMEIVANEWRAGSDLFDVEMKANELTIRRKQRDISMKMVFQPGGAISLDRLNMGYKGFRVAVENREFVVCLPNGGQMRLRCPNIYSSLRLSSNGSISL